MARKAIISNETLAGLGAEKLAQLIIDQAEQDSSFRRTVTAALAGVKGPEAIVKIIDRRIKALSKAKSFIDWQKKRAFQDDLLSIIKIISQELGAVSPALAVEQLLNFIATHEQVFQRIDDSSGAIQNIYFSAVDNVGELCARLNTEQTETLPDKIMKTVSKGSYGYFDAVLEVVVKHLSDAILLRWDHDLAVLQKEHEIKEKNQKKPSYLSYARELQDARQIIASARNDFESLIAFEETKPSHMQNTMAIAKRLFEGERLSEALDWVRKGKQPLNYLLSNADLKDHSSYRDRMASHPALFEVIILDALGENQTAQTLRWEIFEKSLVASVLRDYIKNLPDFEEFDVLDKAFTYVLAQEHVYSALDFFIQWPRFDLAEKLVIQHHKKWSGYYYNILRPAAETLQHDAPSAAIILYRALLNDILIKVRATAYSHAAYYFKKLESLSAHSNDALLQSNGIESHETYRVQLQTDHKRKTAFWALIV